MRRALVLALLLLGLPAASLWAQGTGVVSGRITDQDGTPLNDTQVDILGTRLSTISNAEGRYAIAGVTPGAVVVRATVLGHATAQQTVTVRAGETATADFTLTSEAISLQPLVVVGYGTKRRETLTGSISDV